MATHGGAFGTKGRNLSEMIADIVEKYANETTAREDCWKKLRVQAKTLLTTDGLETLPELDTNAFRRLHTRCSLFSILVKKGSLNEV